MSAPGDPPVPGAMPLIELGWLVVGDPTSFQLDAVRSAHEGVSKTLEAGFPQFRWALPLISGSSAPPSAGIDEPAGRLDEGVQTRDLRGWDFAFVITPFDLRSHYKSHALAVPSRALAVAVISLARLSADVRTAGVRTAGVRTAGEQTAGERSAGERNDPTRLAQRIRTLALHAFGDLNGLWHREASDAVMRSFDSVSDLDRPGGFDDDERERLELALEQVADLRLEEATASPSPFRFYLRASRERAGEIASATLQARPWEFPLRLSRLTTAALSALCLLLVTAEVWDLGTSQRAATIVSLSVGVVALATAFILTRQRLLLRRARTRLSEQAVVMNVSAVLIVVSGLTTTYAMLFASTLLLGFGLFDPDLMARWAPEAAGRGRSLIGMAGLIAALGLLIGSLGASLEGQDYFRHVIYADEET